MNSTRSFTLVKSLVLGTLAASLSAGPVSAQSVYKGKFTLPFEVRWGGAVLPAGDFTFSLNSASLTGIFTVRGEKQTAMILPVAISDRASSGPSELLIAPSAGKRTVRALHLEELGLDFYYRAPKAEKQAIAQAPELLQRIPILVAGK